MTESELDGLQPGDAVLIRGTVVGVNGDSVDVEIGDGMVVPWDFEDLELDRSNAA